MSKVASFVLLSAPHQVLLGNEHQGLEEMHSLPCGNLEDCRVVEARIRDLCSKYPAVPWILIFDTATPSIGAFPCPSLGKLDLRRWLKRKQAEALKQAPFCSTRLITERKEKVFQSVAFTFPEDGLLQRLKELSLPVERVLFLPLALASVVPTLASSDAEQGVTTWTIVALMVPYLAPRLMLFRGNVLLHNQSVVSYSSLQHDLHPIYLYAQRLAGHEEVRPHLIVWGGERVEASWAAASIAQPFQLRVKDLLQADLTVHLFQEGQQTWLRGRNARRLFWASLAVSSLVLTGGLSWSAALEQQAMYWHSKKAFKKAPAYTFRLPVRKALLRLVEKGSLWPVMAVWRQVAEGWHFGPPPTSVSFEYLPEKKQALVVMTAEASGDLEELLPQIKNDMGAQEVKLLKRPAFLDPSKPYIQSGDDKPCEPAEIAFTFQSVTQSPSAQRDHETGL